MDVFVELAQTQRRYFLNCAIAAAHRLGLFSPGTLPGSLQALAQKTSAQPPARLHALLTALSHFGVLVEQNSTFYAHTTPPMPPEPPPAGWGRLAAIIQGAAPEPILDLSAYHHALQDKGRVAAAATINRCFDPPQHLLDAGGGIGTYARLHCERGGRVTLFDNPRVIALARSALADLPQLTFRTGDLRHAELGGPYDHGLLANLLHLHPPQDARRLIRRCAAALRPGGRLVVKDFNLNTDTGRLFNLNMVVFTVAGRVHASAAIARWMTEAGLKAVATHSIAAASDMLLVAGAR